MSSDQAPPPVIPPSALGRPQRFSANSFRDVGIILVPVVLFVVLSFSSDHFFTTGNLVNVLDRSVAVGLIAAAGTLVILAGGFDLSAAAIFAVASILAAEVANATGPAAGILTGLLTGCVLGLANGVLVSWGRVDHIVGTLGTMIAYSGLAVVLAGSGSVLIKDPAFATFANTTILGLPSSSWYLILFVAFCSLILNVTVLGRRIYATGGNVEAARLSGVSVNGTLIIVYTLSGLAAGLAGLLTTASSLSTRADSGASLIFDALAAILIGGNSIRGGRGSMWRTVVGLATLVLISNGFNLLGVDPAWQRIVTGVIILVAVLLDVWNRRQSR